MQQFAGADMKIHLSLLDLPDEVLLYIVNMLVIVTDVDEFARDVQGHQDTGRAPTRSD